MSTFTTKIYRTIENVDVETLITSTGSVTVQDYYYIGKIEPDTIDSTVYDSGIFVDSNLPKGAKLNIYGKDTNGLDVNNDISCDPITEVHESWVIYTEIGVPDWYKWTSTIPYNEGDGQQITGMTTIEGCLVVFKEHSIIREVWQGLDPPNSQRSDVNRQIGCIAPLTLININDNAYFLSAEGLYVYNNNTVVPVDKVFNEELKKIMFGVDGKLLENMRDASCGYNPIANELYLNIPPLPNYRKNIGTIEEYDYIQNNTNMNFIEEFFGHVYVVSLNKGYTTKFGYQSTVLNRFSNQGVEVEGTIKLKEITDSKQMVRMYYTNSNAELRSADIRPIKYSTSTKSYTVALMYIETPYLRTEKLLYPNFTEDIIYRDKDDILDVTNAPFYNGVLTPYPPYILAPIKTKWKSKFFTGGTEVYIKRLREVILNLFSKGVIKVKVVAMPFETWDEINDEFFTTGQEIIYPPSVDALQPLSNTLLKGMNRNVIYWVPQTPNLRVVRNTVPNDFLGKSLKFSVEIETELRTQINSVVLKLRTVNI
jgi:hypothetical protein